MPVPGILTNLLRAIKPVGGYFFLRGESTRMDTCTDLWRRQLSRVFKNAKIPNGHPHRFRDTFAVELLLAGVPIEHVSILLGHSSIRITERHYAREIALKGRTSPGTRVRDVMSTTVVVARPDQTVEECKAIMTAKAVRHLPVLENGHLVGLVSIGDMVKSVIGDQKFIIEQLEHYIHGQR